MNSSARRSLVPTLILPLLAGCAADLGGGDSEALSTRAGGLGTVPTADAYCDDYGNTIFVPAGGIVGGVAAHTVDGRIEVELTTNNGWSLTEVRLWAGGLEDFPLDSAFQPDFDAMPFQAVLDPTETSFNATLDMPEVIACDGLVKLAMWFALEGPDGETAVQQQYAHLLNCCDEDVVSGCTLTQGFWKNHHAMSRGQRAVAWPIPESTLLCGRTWLNWFGQPPRGGNAWIILVHQWMAASLNVASGASTPANVAAALADGEALLQSCSVSSADRSTAIALAELLDDYNNGFVGPGHCD